MRSSMALISSMFASEPSSPKSKKKASVKHLNSLIFNFGDRLIAFRHRLATQQPDIMFVLDDMVLDFD